MITRPVILGEEPTPMKTRAVSLTGDKAVCGDIGGPACMCQPSDHGGKGACGKVLDAEECNAALALVAEVRR
jgi:hypothetical protein